MNLTAEAIFDITSVEIWASDLARSAGFYQGVVGLALGEAHRHEGNEDLHYDAR